MRKKLLLLILIVAFSTLFAGGCDGMSSDGEYNVTFVFGNGAEDITVKTVFGRVTLPDEPEWYNRSFIGWSKDADKRDFYDFSEKVASDITLFAVWELDYEAIAVSINADIMKSNVKVYSEHYDNNPFFPSATSQGSGVIYKEYNGYYYILTNNHVLIKSDSYLQNRYKVYDLYGNEYAAELVISDPSYDLGVIRIRKLSSISLGYIDIADKIPEKSESVISLGSPRGQFNAVTYGPIYAYKTVDINDQDALECNIEFPIIWHKAHAAHGSSGGALLNADLELIGINFAIANDENGEFLYGFAVPGEKIPEFLIKNSVE
jgi:S1-C subfamily serine protease